jgi:hypothetical protein
MSRTLFRGFRGFLTTLLLTALAPEDALGIPAFARRYRASCQLCHNPAPRLTAFGEQFAANGMRFAAGEEVRDTIDTGDLTLSLMREVPLAIRLDFYSQLYTNGTTATDFQTPYGVKLLSGGPLSTNISYYFYTFLSERGGLGGVEDAWLQLNDVGGKPIDLFVGQFQISDPLFKRELRLEFEDYAVYRVRVGDVPLNLTYDRGVMATADLQGFSFAGMVVNGNGRGEALGNRRFDDDRLKNFFMRVSRDFGAHVRLGAAGLAGQTQSKGVTNTTRLAGLDVTVSTANVELNGQFIHREDNAPTFALTDEPLARTQGGFAELLIAPPEQKWYAFLLYNGVSGNRPILDVRLGGNPDITHYTSVSAGWGRRERRNLRWTAETTWVQQEKSLRWTLGVITAF